MKLAVPRGAREANCVNGLVKGLGRSCPIDLQCILVGRPKPPLHTLPEERR